MIKLSGLLLCIYAIGVFILGASITGSLFVFHVGVVPMIFKYSKTFRRNLVFANFVQWPLNINHDEPSSSGIDGARNLSIEYQSKVDKCKVKIGSHTVHPIEMKLCGVIVCTYGTKTITLRSIAEKQWALNVANYQTDIYKKNEPQSRVAGIWHILPDTVYQRLKDKFNIPCDKEELNRILDEELATTSSPIMLYFHGNSNSRAATHRIELYKFFQKMDFHTIAFDYRGYGDSTNLNPTEDGVVEDSLIVYEWLNSTPWKTVKPPIFVWGHSLGTAISSHLLGNLQELSVTLLERSSPLPLPNGLILEAPFNNLADEVAKIPLSKLVTWLPYFECAFVTPFRNDPGQTFKSDEHLSKVKNLPILILHAKDDVIVPFKVGVQLFRSIQKSRSITNAKVKFHAFAKDEALGHKYICHAKNLDIVVRQFIVENK